MKLVVGLGNPGAKYQFQRHNIGFMVIDALAELHGRPSFKSEHKALVAKFKMNDDSVLLAKPQTFMNLSGESVRPLMDYYGVALSDVLVIHDEIDIPFSAVRFHIKRGHGGHNGIRSTHQHLGGDNYARLKMGVGRPAHAGQDVAAFVLEDFNKTEASKLPEFLKFATDAVQVFLESGIEATANKFNGLPPLFEEGVKP